MNEKFDLELLYKKIVNTNLKTGVKLTSVEKNELKKILNRQTLGLQGAFLNFIEKDEKFEKNYCFLQDKKGYENKQLNLKTHSNNLLIEGENYHALIALKQANVKVDIIYIDPPYNTGKEFIFNDKIIDLNCPYVHSKWLSFMKKRLEVAKKLLKDDGVILVSIDDNEQAYLKVLMDEIFGDKNFINTIIWNKTEQGATMGNNFKKTHEYIHFYSKISKKNFNLNLEKQDFDSKKFNLKDKKGFYALSNKLNSINSYLKNNRNRGYTIYYNSKKKDVKIVYEYNKETLIFEKTGDQALLKDNYLRILPGLRKGKQTCWNWGVKKFKEDWKTEIIFKKDNKNEIFPYVKNRYKGVKNPFTIQKFDSRKTGNGLLNKIFDNVPFDNPKPVELIAWLIERKTNNKNAIILDFFAGSGTTGHAVLELNKKDGGDRRFILINEKKDVNIGRNISKKIAYERLYRIIEGKGTKNEKINWEFSKEQKSFSNSSLRFLELKYVDKINGEFEEIEKSRIKSLYKTEFNHELTIVDVIDHD